MAFLRFARDKRGYEHFYLVQTTTRRGKSRNRILYWFRTPPGVKVGRLPFDEHVRRALEARYPDIAFDWQALIDTPIPPPAPDVERWRERRRLERATKQAAAADAAAGSQEPASESGESAEGDDVEATAPVPAGIAGTARTTDGAAKTEVGTAASTVKRRRRRGRRGRPGADVPADAAASGQSAPASVSADGARAASPNDGSAGDKGASTGEHDASGDGEE